MSFFRGIEEKIPEVDTTVWACTGEDCIGWMRESYSFEKEPSCPLCEADMVQEVRLLPEIN